MFALETKRVIPSGQIAPSRVANGNARFGSSCPLTELLSSLSRPRVTGNNSHEKVFEGQLILIGCKYSVRTLIGCNTYCNFRFSRDITVAMLLTKHFLLAWSLRLLHLPVSRKFDNSTLKPRP